MSQYATVCLSAHTLPKLTGTQTVDQVWRHLKRFVPESLRTRCGSGEKDHPRLEQYVGTQYVWDFVFRFNHRDNLLADLAKMANKKRLGKKPLMTVRVLNELEHEDHVMHIELPKTEISLI